MKTARLLLASIFSLTSLAANAQILAMVNYESKPNHTPRREGIAIIDVDPASAQFGKILNDIPLSPDTIAHHIFYNQDLSKAYITALGSSPLQVMDMNHVPFHIKKIDVPDCKVSEDMVFSKDNKTWYLTCMGSSNVIMGNAQTDTPIKTISANSAEALIQYPHGISLNESIDRIIVANTVNPGDLKDAAESVAVLEASTGKVLSSHKLSDKPSPSNSAPVEAVFLPGVNPPMAYITTMFGGALWTASWNGENKNFDFDQIYDFAELKQGVPLEIYFNDAHDRLYITTASPGYFNIFDISDSPKKPKLLKSIATAEGAHHVVFTPDEHYAIVQNSLLNLPGMSDGSLTVIDLKTANKIASLDVLKKQGLNPNSIVLMPHWHHDDAH